MTVSAQPSRQTQRRARLAERLVASRGGVALLVGVCALVAAMIVATHVGALRTPWDAPLRLLGELLGLDRLFGVDEPGLTAGQRAVLLNLRIPRVLFAAVVGAALGLSGAAVQGLFRNPLAAPEVIGASAGAACGAVIAIMLVSWFTIPLGPTAGLAMRPVFAFVGAVAVTAALYRFATGEHGTSVLTMLLAGIAANALMMSVVGLASFLSDDAALRDITLWMLGSLSSATWASLGIVSLVLLVGGAWLMRSASALDLLLLGEAEAGHLGTDVPALKRRVIVASSLVLSAAIAFVGLISFVGLVVPHMVRLVVGPGHRWLLPVSAVSGAALLTFADTLARTIAAPAELPIGVLTALIGGPVFLLLLRSTRRELGVTP